MRSRSSTVTRRGDGRKVNGVSRGAMTWGRLCGTFKNSDSGLIRVFQSVVGRVILWFPHFNSGFTNLEIK